MDFLPKFVDTLLEPSIIEDTSPPIVNIVVVIAIPFAIGIQLSNPCLYQNVSEYDGNGPAL
jgi:hypothetical protein